MKILFSKTIFFPKQSFLKKQSYKKQSLIVFIKGLFSETIVIHFLKVQNEWVVFKNDRFFSKKQSKNDRQPKPKQILFLDQIP